MKKMDPEIESVLDDETTFDENKPIEEIGFYSSSNKSYIKPFTLVDILNMPDHEQEWIVQDLIPSNGITIVSGLPNHFKSFFVQKLSFCVASGEDFLGRFEVTKGKVLIIDREVPTIRLKNRWKQIINKRTEDIIFYSYEDSFKLDDKNDIECLNYLVDEYEVKLVVIDTFNRSHSEKDMSSARDTGLIFSPLKKLISKTSVILIHHSGKKAYQRDEPTPEELLGSIDLTAETDVLITLRKHDENRFSVHQIKSRYSQMINPFNVVFNKDDDDIFQFTIEGDYKKAISQTVEKEEIILDLLKRGRTKKKELIENCKEIGIPEGTANNILTRLKKTMKVNSVQEKGEAVYFLVDNFHSENGFLPSQSYMDKKEGNIVEEAEKIFGVEAQP